jgi:hypothetical protein
MSARQEVTSFVAQELQLEYSVNNNVNFVSKDLISKENGRKSFIIVPIN